MLFAILWPTPSPTIPFYKGKGVFLCSAFWAKENVHQASLHGYHHCGSPPDSTCPNSLWICLEAQVAVYWRCPFMVLEQWYWASGLETVLIRLLEINIPEDSLNSKLPLCVTEQLETPKTNRAPAQSFHRKLNSLGALPAFPQFSFNSYSRARMLLHGSGHSNTSGPTLTAKASRVVGGGWIGVKGSLGGGGTVSNLWVPCKGFFFHPISVSKAEQIQV